MFSLFEEGQLKIIEMLSPEELKNLYDASPEYGSMIDNLVLYFGITVNCPVIISIDLWKWFHTKKINVRLIESFTRSFGICSWYKNGELHRDGDLPAVIWHHGSKEWYRYGKRHRDHGPAMITPTILDPNVMLECWYKNGDIVRTKDRNYKYIKMYISFEE